MKKVIATLPTELGEEITRGSYGITDGNLYNALIAEYNQMYLNELEFVPLDKVYLNMFANATELDLSNKLIYNLTGFSVLNMPNLTNLNI